MPDQLTVQSRRVKFQVCRRFEALWAVLAGKPLTLTIKSSITRCFGGTIFVHAAHILEGKPSIQLLEYPIPPLHVTKTVTWQYLGNQEWYHSH